MLGGKSMRISADSEDNRTLLLVPVAEGLGVGTRPVRIIELLGRTYSVKVGKRQAPVVIQPPQMARAFGEKVIIEIGDTHAIQV
jgi:hypothetical protein